MCVSVYRESKSRGRKTKKLHIGVELNSVSTLGMHIETTPNYTRLYAARSGANGILQSFHTVFLKAFFVFPNLNVRLGSAALHAIPQKSIQPGQRKFSSV